MLIGGTPLRVLRLSAAGAQVVAGWAAGTPVGIGEGERQLARRLVDGAVAHPVPSSGGGPGRSEVTVVIPVLDDHVGLDRTLATVGPCAGTIVVDDGSGGAASAAIAAVVERHGATLVRHERSLGPGAARETGWRAAGSPFVAFVDADVEVADGWLGPLLDHFGDPSLGAVAPRVRSAAGAAPPWLAAYEAVRSSLDLGPMPAPVRPGSRVPYVPTAAIVLRRAALEDVGGFDPALRVGEDVDLVWRLHAAGWRVRYEPAVTATHPCRASSGAWLRQRYRYGTAAAGLARRHGDAVSPLTVSGWSAAAWGLVGLGHPVVGVALAGATTAALAPKLRSLEHPARESIRIAGLGNLHAGRSVADALRRPWWPAAALLLWGRARSRPALAAAAILPALSEWRARRPSLHPAVFVGVRLLDDLVYGTGVLAGCAADRSSRALRPAFTGACPPPTPPMTPVGVGGGAPGYARSQLDEGENP